MSLNCFLNKNLVDKSIEKDFYIINAARARVSLAGPQLPDLSELWSDL